MEIENGKMRIPFNFEYIEIELQSLRFSETSASISAIKEIRVICYVQLNKMSIPRIRVQYVFRI